MSQVLKLAAVQRNTVNTPNMLRQQIIHDVHPQILEIRVHVLPDDMCAWTIVLASCSVRARRRLALLVPSAIHCRSRSSSENECLHEWLRRSVARAVARATDDSQQCHIMCVQRHVALDHARGPVSAGFPVHRGVFREAMRHRPREGNVIRLTATGVGDSEICDFQVDYVRKLLSSPYSPHMTVTFHYSVPRGCIRAVDHVQSMQHHLQLPWWKARHTRELAAYIECCIKRLDDFPACPQAPSRAWTWEQAKHAVSLHVDETIRRNGHSFPKVCTPLSFEHASWGERARYKLSSDGQHGTLTFCPSRLTPTTLAAICAHEIFPGHHLQLSHQFNNTALPLVKRYRMMTPVKVYTEGWACYAETITCAQTQRMRRRLEASRADILFHNNRALYGIDLLRQQHPHLDDRDIVRILTHPGEVCAYVYGEWVVTTAVNRLRAKGWTLQQAHEIILNAGETPPDILLDLVHKQPTVRSDIASRSDTCASVECT